MSVAASRRPSTIALAAIIVLAVRLRRRATVRGRSDLDVEGRVEVADSAAVA